MVASSVSEKQSDFIFLPFLLQVILILQNSLGVKEQFSTAKNFALMSKFLQNHLLVLSI